MFFMEMLYRLVSSVVRLTLSETPRSDSEMLYIYSSLLKTAFIVCIQ